MTSVVTIDFYSKSHPPHLQLSMQILVKSNATIQREANRPPNCLSENVSGCYKLSHVIGAVQGNDHMRAVYIVLASVILIDN
jgi:hypothetical protein